MNYPISSGGKDAMGKAENINPEILTWAREKACLSLDEAAKKIGVTPEKLKSIEAGEEKLARSSLSKLAKAYFRPLVTFYLNEPPRPDEQIADFRKSKNDVSEKDEFLLKTLLRKIQVRQSIVRSLLESDEDAKKLSFIRSISKTTRIPEVANSIRETLGVTGTDNDFESLRSSAERIGVFVILEQDVGSYHSDISEKVFRGVSMADDIAPFIVINGHDTEKAKSFILIHELTHLFLGNSGISNGSYDPHYEDLSGDEKFCNQVAGEFLLPEKFLLESIGGQITSVSVAQKTIHLVATRHNVSKMLVAYRLFQTKKITKDVYQEVHEYHLHGIQDRPTERDKRGKNKGGSGYYRTRKKRLGSYLPGLVKRAVQENELTYTKAATVLNVSLNTVHNVLFHDH